MAATIYGTAPVGAPAVAASRRRWAGRILTGIALLFLTFDALIKLFPTREAIEGTTALGY